MRKQTLNCKKKNKRQRSQSEKNNEKIAIIGKEALVCDELLARRFGISSFGTKKARIEGLEEDSVGLRGDDIEYQGKIGALKRSLPMGFI